jgi:tetratricopeptide (TPR) repeat protein
LRYALVLAAALAATGAHAIEFCDKIGALAEHRREVDRLWKAFTAKQFDEVERFHSALVGKHEAGELSDAHLARFFSAFQAPDAYVEPLIMSWAAKYPDSAAPWLALAHYYAQVGFAARGGEEATRTAEAQFVAMGAAFRKALYALEMADKRMKKHSLSASMKIWLGSTVKSTRPSPTEIYRSAIRAWPDTLQVRIRYVRASAPRWGGSDTQLAAIVEDAKTLSPEDRRYMEYLVTQELARTQELKGDTRKAIETYQRSVPMCPGLDRSLEQLIDLQRRTRDFAGLAASSSTFIERHPRSGWAFSTRGWARQELKHYAEAFADFQRATQLGYGDGFLRLAWYYEQGIVAPRDVRKAMDLYLTAESHGIAEGRVRAEKLSRITGIPPR